MATGESDLHDLIRESVRGIASEFDRGYWKEHIDQKEFPEEYWQALADDGWLGVTIPEEYGGEGLGMLEMCIIIEELSRSGGQGGIIFVLTPVFGGIGIQRHGNEAQKEEYLPQIADGEMKFCMALTEPTAGSNTLNIQTTADRDGDEFVVNGQKTFISGVENADTMLLVTRTTERDDENPTHGVTLFLVDDPAAQPGINLAEVDTAVPWFERQYQVTFDDLRVSEDDILGTEDGGLYLLWDTLNTERLAGAASSLGGGLRAIDLAVDYASDRSVFGQPIGAHQSIQHPIAESYAKLMSAREIMYKGAQKWDENEDCGLEANVAKLLTSQAGTEAADRAIQAHGGNGFTDEYEVYDIWQNLRLTQTVPVANELVLNYIAEHELDLPRSY
ncbi:acyl-CoA dehydrogenase [Natronomonas pharaonis DSM 2160]|uniref:Acyl-CoA dehydrogenase n=1 Tax=Natronomonas pharaonis (strain ATCC 35678 / DSM 2160 / CIP 103997 / JCM 8858 / NBRC 14720 / NCIMB 2260 / Gabara) TaxID=348780 RepID=A0A1U7EXC1_NATPD|nr:acyl-CoA dehydrogenase family protein [Natronomonas pharaonis]CAI49821.1 acyl-CoA dehydrogenase [Natronomonas pharaonis DSM 2160]